VKGGLTTEFTEHTEKGECKVKIKVKGWLTTEDTEGTEKDGM
jgi:hypothetical protein